MESNLFSSREVREVREGFKGGKPYPKNLCVISAPLRLCVKNKKRFAPYSTRFYTFYTAKSNPRFRVFRGSQSNQNPETRN